MFLLALVSFFTTLAFLPFRKLETVAVLTPFLPASHPAALTPSVLVVLAVTAVTSALCYLFSIQSLQVFVCFNVSIVCTEGVGQGKLFRHATPFSLGRPRLDLEYPVYGAHELADKGAFTSVVVLGEASRMQ